MHDRGTPDNAASLRAPAMWLLVAAGVLLLLIALVMQDLTRSNRPHELANAPWVAGIALLNLVPCVAALRGLVRFRREHGTNRAGRFEALLAGLVLVAVPNTLILAGALRVLPDVLGAA